MTILTRTVLSLVVFLGLIAPGLAAADAPPGAFVVANVPPPEEPSPPPAQTPADPNAPTINDAPPAPAAEPASEDPMAAIPPDKIESAPAAGTTTQNTGETGGTPPGLMIGAAALIILAAILSLMWFRRRA